MFSKITWAMFHPPEVQQMPGNTHISQHQYFKYKHTYSLQDEFVLKVHAYFVTIPVIYHISDIIISGKTTEQCIKLPHFL